MPDTTDLTLAAICPTSDALLELPAGWRTAVQPLLERVWAQPAARMQGARTWALADRPGEPPAVDVGGPCLDAHGALRLGSRCAGHPGPLAGLAELEAHLRDWSGRRCAHWDRLIAAVHPSIALRRQLMNALVPLEWQLRDALAQRIWARSLQGELAPIASGAPRHALAPVLLHWLLRPSQAAGIARRHDLLRRAGGAVALLISQQRTHGGQAPLRRLAELADPARPRPTLRRIAQALAPCLALPAWVLRRIAHLPWHQLQQPGDTTLAALGRLAVQLPPAAWPRQPHDLDAASRCLSSLDLLCSFGDGTLAAAPAKHALPNAVRRWLLGELRRRYGGDWLALADALTHDEPRYQLLTWVLPRLHDHWQADLACSSEQGEQLSSTWRKASPCWWLDRLLQWQSAQHRPHRPPGRRARLRWSPLFAAPQRHGDCLLRCLASVREVQALLQDFALTSLQRWIGPSLVSRVQWLHVQPLGAAGPGSLALLLAELQRGTLRVRVVCHWGPLRSEPPAACHEALREMLAYWQEEGWGVLSRIEAEEVLSEDPELRDAITAARVKSWTRLASVAQRQMPSLSK